jgi:hypothetical protein
MTGKMEVFVWVPSVVPDEFPQWHDCGQVITRSSDDALLDLSERLHVAD